MTENSYNPRRKFCSAVGESYNIHEVLPQVLTLAPDVSPWYTDPVGDHSGTYFREVQVVPAEESWSQSVRDFIAEPRPRQNVSLQSFLFSAFNAIETVVENTWKPDKFHVLLHSSGWDSRMISLIIRRLTDKHGTDWLGKVLFLEGDGEGQGFRQIMSYLNWAPEQYHVHGEKFDGPNRHWYAFQFDRSWRQVNGACAFPFCVFNEAYEYCQKDGIIPSDDQVQLYTGYGANEMAYMMSGRGLDDFSRHHYYQSQALWPLHAEWIAPYFSLRLADVFLRLGMGQPTVWRSQAVEMVAPELAKVPRMTGEQMYALGCRDVSTQLLEKAFAEYNTSWYNKVVHPSVSPTASYRGESPWWFHYTLASFCEWIIKSGREIRVGK